MQVIIPLAGKGTRLRPHTHLVPKPLLKVAGRPVMDWVMDTLSGLEISELIFITGHLKEQVEDYARTRYPYPSRFIEQKVQDGTAGAVNLARPFVREPVLIVFVDTVFEADLSLIHRAKADGIIWAKEVEDYQRFGVVVTDAEGYMTRIVEKPSEPISKLANIGLYYIRDVEALWRGVDHVLGRPKHLGEYYLTDAFQHMIEHGRKLLTARVEGWYDCGKLETLLETNEILLRRGAARRRDFPGVTVLDPVLIEDEVLIEESVIGPNVTIERGTRIRGSRLEHTLVGAGVELSGCALHHSMLGDRVVVKGLCGRATLGDDSEVAVEGAGA
ncbi:MAG TPA: sugar phosphate nucleotidyltransferase [Gemmatimonadales bacterium]|jgi:glucose-1-phosphate thymidylyltransferase|nr:sugar phosphate nucleotidyltransferase [Gemmatimonadales bacterium]